MNDNNTICKGDTFNMEQENIVEVLGFVNDCDVQFGIVGTKQKIFLTDDEIFGMEQVGDLVLIAKG